MGSPLTRKESLVGAKLGPYEIVRFIGQGGTAAVFEARHAQGARVAIKILHDHVADRAEHAGRFLREGRAAAQLHHPHALEVVDVGEHGGLVYLVAELLEGVTLHEHLIAHRALPAEEALALLLPIAAALSHAHAQGVVHRDVKPGNVLLAKGAQGDVVPKLIDFGLSKSIDAPDAGPPTATGVVMGTVAYMAPEQTMGIKLTTAKSDQYALGAVLYECLAGRPPFAADGFYELLELVRTGVAPPPSLVNARVEAEIDGPIMRALHRDPAKRFADVRAFATVLLPFASAIVADAWRGELGRRVSPASSSSLQAARPSWVGRAHAEPDAAGARPSAAPAADELAQTGERLVARARRSSSASMRIDVPARPSAPPRTAAAPSHARVRGEAATRAPEPIARRASPEEAPPLRRVRSTLVCSGLAEIRARGRFDEYASKLDAQARDVLVNAIAGVWLPLDVTMKHYAAVESLALPAEDAFQIGAAAGKRIQESALQTLVRLASGAGATPWTVFQVYENLWKRIMDGGAFEVSRAGPKDAVIEYRGMPPCRFAYFREAFRGANHAGLSLFAKSVYVHEVANKRSEQGMALRCAWV